MVARIVENVDPRAQAFFYVGSGYLPPWYGQIAAVQASQRTGVPTINLYTGRTPTGAERLLAKSVASGPAALPEVRSELAAWVDERGLDADRVQTLVEYELWQQPATR